jgi:hypothetical protein
VQIGNLEVLVNGAVGRQVEARAEALGAGKFKASLKDIGHIGIAAAPHCGAPIDQKYGDGAHALFGAVG